VTKDQQVELVIMCCLYRVRNPEHTRLCVSKEIRHVLTTAGCDSKGKISACSLGMYMNYLTDSADDYFGHWAAAVDPKVPLEEATKTVAAFLQTQHLSSHHHVHPNGKALSLTKLYNVFSKVCSPFSLHTHTHTHTHTHQQ
jgi:hypothetical protein